jgi:ubiquinol-cytochrome c reductase cytochrome b subunit
VIPGLVAGYFVALPVLDRGPSRELGHRWWAVGTAVALVAAVAGMTAFAARADARDPGYRRARALADRRAARAQQLAAAGIPPEGPLEMVRNDPQVRPGVLFEELCATCHARIGTRPRDAHGNRTRARAPTLEGFGSRAWARAMITDPDHADLFGRTNIHDMPSQVRRLAREGPGALEAVAEYLYAQSIEPGDPTADPALAQRGDAVFHTRCTQCHQGRGDHSGVEPGDRDAPDLTGWGSREYIHAQILRPASTERYGARNQMPSFADQLQGRELEWVVDYVRSLRSHPGPVVAPPPEGDDGVGRP